MAQLLQGQNSLPFPLQQQSLNAAGLSPQSQGLPLSLLGLLGSQGLPGTQLGSLGTPLHNLANQRLLAAPFTALGAGFGRPQLLGNMGLGGTQLLSNPGLLGMLPAVNRLGGLAANGQPGARHLSSFPSTLGLPLLGQAPAKHDNLEELIRLASLLSNETRSRRNTLSTPGTRIQLTGTFNTTPRHPHPLHRLLSLPVSDLAEPSVSRLDDDSSYSSLRDNYDSSSISDIGARRSSLVHPIEFGGSSHRPKLPVLPLAAGNRGKNNDSFRFPQ